LNPENKGALLHTRLFFLRNEKPERIEQSGP
jgi:hypothetical protein